MTDRHAEGIEKAAKAVKDSMIAQGPNWFEEDQEYWNERRGGLHVGLEALVECVAVARAAVTAYSGHMYPEVASAEELDSLPVGAILHDREGAIWETGHEDGYTSNEIPLPARVIHWGRNDA